MDSVNDDNKVSLPGAGEIERTVLEEQRLSNISETSQINNSTILTNESSDNETQLSIIEIDENLDKVQRPDKFEFSPEETQDILKQVEDIIIEAQKSIEDLVEEISESEQEENNNLSDCEDLQYCVEVTDHSDPFFNDIILAASLQQEADINRPPIPLQTYRWEDLRRSKEQGGYPWTHLYKSPLGSDEEPEIIFRLNTLPKSKTRRKIKSQLIDADTVPRFEERVTVTQENIVLNTPTENLTENLSENISENNNLKTHTSLPDLTLNSDSPTKSNSAFLSLKRVLKRPSPIKFDKLKLNLFKENKEKKENKEESSETTPPLKKTWLCSPLVEKIKTMADKQINKVSHKKTIKKIHLEDDEKIDLENDEQVILKLKESPKDSGRREISSFIQKQDSDELEIIELDESPSETRKRRDQAYIEDHSTIVVPDEIIEIVEDLKPDELIISEDILIEDQEATVSEILEDELKIENKNAPPPKAPRKKKEHVYEDIDDYDPFIQDMAEKQILDSISNDLKIESNICLNDVPISEDKIENDSVKMSLRLQDEKVQYELDEAQKRLDQLVSQSSEEEKPTQHLLAPISSIDSTSSDEERKVQLSPVAEESDTGSRDFILEERKPSNMETEVVKQELLAASATIQPNSSPGSEKRVTFSPSTEDDSDLIKEDIVLAEEIPIDSRWAKMSDHEYEPIGEPEIESPEDIKESNQENMPSNNQEGAVGFDRSEHLKRTNSDVSSITSNERKLLRVPTEDEDELSIQELQDQLEDTFFNARPSTAESRTDNEIHTSQVDSSAIEDLPLQRENRKKSMMTNLQDRSKNMQQKFKNQAGKMKSKLKGVKKPASESPKAKERKKFKAPEFTKKIHMPKMPEFKKFEMPKMKAPEMPKFKKPEFPKISKPEMPKFKMPEKFATFKIRRSGSLKENTPTVTEFRTEIVHETGTKKKLFDFGTYPRIFDRKKKEKPIPVESDATSVELPTIEFTRVGKKKSLDNESGNYQQYDDDIELNERESSLERRMKIALEYASDDDRSFNDKPNLTEEQRQMEEYDRENMAIHAQSKLKEDDFRDRKPIIRQESDLNSEDDKILEWVKQESLRNKLLGRDDSSDLHSDELEIINRANFKYENELNDYEKESRDLTPLTNQETQSSGSSGLLRREGVIEEIDDDEFFLRKRGISEGNVQISEYISSALRDGLRTPPRNTLAQVGLLQRSYDDDDLNISNEKLNFEYATEDHRFDKSFESDDMPRYDNDFDYNKNYFETVPPPRRPLRSKQYSQDSDEKYYQQEQEHMNRMYANEHMEGIEQPNILINNEEIKENINSLNFPPVAPKRKKRRTASVDKDSITNELAGRSISNDYIPNGNADDVIVYRTEHEYIVPLAHVEQFNTPTPSPRRTRSRSQMSRYTDDDRTSHGAESLTSDSRVPCDEPRCVLDIRDANGYAIVKKEAPPRPPAPIRRKKGVKDFFTLQHTKKQTSAPVRPKRTYTTIGHNRREKSESLSELQRDSYQSSPDVTQYEELDDDLENMLSQKDWRSGEILSKMKDRPLPPPPAPPRTSRKNNKKHDTDQDEDQHPDLDNDAERIKIDENIEEFERSTQTDALPADYRCEEFEITTDMRRITPTKIKTLADILKEEQEAELERARQLADESLSRGLNRFRDANQKSWSERSKGSTADRPRTPSSRQGSRPITPAAVIIENRHINENTTRASLHLQPIEYMDETDSNIDVEQEKEKSPTEHKKEDDNERLNYLINRIEAEIIRQTALESREEQEDEEEEEKINNTNKIEPEPVIESVEQINDPELETLPVIPPSAPPRRRSSATAPAPINSELNNLDLTSNRVQISELDVDRLNVNSLQAGRITVSELQGVTIDTQELSCNSGNLVVKSIELPPGFIEEIVDRIRERDNKEAEEKKENNSSQKIPLQEDAPARPPPPQTNNFYPHEFFSMPPASFYQLRSYSEEEPTAQHGQKKRKNNRRRSDSTSEDDQQQREPRSRRHGTRSPEPTVMELGGQLARACGSAVNRTGRSFLSLLGQNPNKDEKKDFHVALIIIIVIIAALLMFGMSGDRNVHHHHWDFFNPPGNNQNSS